MDRRTFLKTTAFSSLATFLGQTQPEGKTHILTFSFDDGFKKSFYKIAEIYEAHGLSACFNVIASGHFPTFQAVDEWILPELMGNFDDWNALQERGHEIMPHSWKHLNLAKQPIEESKSLIIRCLDYFEKNLDGFSSQKAVFNFPFNASTPELEAFTLTQVRGLRSRGNGAITSIPVQETPISLGCRSAGPKNIDNFIQKMVNDFLESPGGWMILNTHGLDEEGWGPMSSSFFTKLIQRLASVDYLELLPTGLVLNRKA